MQLFLFPHSGPNISAAFGAERPREALVRSLRLAGLPTNQKPYYLSAANEALMPRWHAEREFARAVALLWLIGEASAQTGHQHGRTLDSRGPDRTASLEPADVSKLSDPVPQVRHYKVPGRGYTKHSPLYAKQTVWGGAAPQAPEKTTTTWKPLEARPWKEDAMERSDITEPSPVLVQPASTTVQCITNLTCQFFAVYTVLFLLQSSTRLGLTALQREEKSFGPVVETVHFVPMLCVLFMATRMRAVQLTHGEPEQYELPQWWVKAAMQSCSWWMLALTVIVLLTSCLHVEAVDSKVKRPTIGPTMLRYLRDFVMMIVYISFTVVCVGACTMQAPPGLAPPPERAALACTLCLTFLYFGVFLARAAATFANRAGILGQARRFGNAQEVLRSATATVAFAPMLAVLFIAASIRAMQVGAEPSGGRLPAWVQACFYACTVSVFLQTACVVAIFVISPDDAEPAGEDLGAAPPPGGPRRRAAARAVEYLRWFLMAVCLALWVVSCARQAEARAAPGGPQQGRGGSSVLEQCLQNAKVQIQFCPMLCVLFLACLLRALRATGGRGAPQAWCQAAERVATGAVVCLVLLSFEQLLSKAVPKIVKVCAVCKYIFVAALYASALACIFALYTITADTAVTGELSSEPIPVLAALGRRMREPSR
ncbi:unnamed protein product [Prorocentrum cordatum]|uniref:Protein RFT1 homolog n=1 Tax=Prorocentrum cordatum TaxID=2364126 RepID=A0ABN9U9S5_9DINO|nr:unnamed protein product [Polarella glacialis]